MSLIPKKQGIPDMKQNNNKKKSYNYYNYHHNYQQRVFEQNKNFRSFKKFVIAVSL
jgi:hypothetical protein